MKNSASLRKLRSSLRHFAAERKLLDFITNSEQYRHSHEKNRNSHVTFVRLGSFLYLKRTRITIPVNASCHACAIIPGRRLLRNSASVLKRNP